MLIDEFMSRMLLLFPDAELSMDDDKQLVISTGWFEDPDENEHCYIPVDGSDDGHFQELDLEGTNGE